jgi:hypothetical protein
MSGALHSSRFHIKKINKSTTSVAMGINYFQLHKLLVSSITSHQSKTLFMSLYKVDVLNTVVTTLDHIPQHLPQMFTAKDKSMVFSLECKSNEKTFANHLITVTLLFSYCDYIYASVSFGLTS